MKTEHEIFTDFIESITWAQACAIELGQARPDQPWNQVATKLEELKQGLWQMVGDGAVKGTRQ